MTTDASWVGPALRQTVPWVRSAGAEIGYVKLARGPRTAKAVLARPAAPYSPARLRRSWRSSTPVLDLVLT